MDMLNCEARGQVDPLGAGNRSQVDPEQRNRHRAAVQLLQSLLIELRQARAARLRRGPASLAKSLAVSARSSMSGRSLRFRTVLICVYGL